MPGPLLLGSHFPAIAGALRRSGREHSGGAVCGMQQPTGRTTMVAFTQAGLLHVSTFIYMSSGSHGTPMGTSFRAQPRRHGTEQVRSRPRRNVRRQQCGIAEHMNAVSSTLLLLIALRMAFGATEK